ncbi:MAG: YlmC/YmxH family sporulation protein [Clostridia bacterium]|nr:YlmC/YmxH family sporulation protein [Clostridia bacterium]
MCCRIVEMREKQVICIKTGELLGCVGDIEVDTCCGKLVSIIVFGQRGCLGFGRCEEFKIPWDCIEVIGSDTILVNFEVPHGNIRRRRGIFGALSGE